MQFNGIYNLTNNAVNSFRVSSDAAIYNREELIKMLQIEENININKEISSEDLILKSYERWEEESPKHLVGDFSFALHNEEKKHLFCARDHLGIRPFYYYHTKDLFAFSSDLDTLFSLTDILKKPDLESMHAMAQHRSIAHDKTMYKNIKRLPPGHTLTVNKAGTIHIDRYWKPELIHPDKTITLKEAAQGFNTLFTEAIRCRLPKEGTVGCDLSGGLDSSSVCSVVHTLTDENIVAFSMRFGEYHCDEGIHIKAVAKSLGIAPVEIQIDKVDFTNDYNMDFNYKVGPHWPIFLTYTQLFPVAKAIQKRDIKVVLTGQGSDHVMSGSRHMLVDQFKTHQWKKLFQELSALGFSRKNIKNYLLIPLLTDKQKKMIKQILEKFHLRKKIDKKEVKTSENTDNTMLVYSKAFQYDIDILINSGFSTIFDSSPYHGARKLYGIEYRHPFFDIRLVEFMLSLPAEFKYSKKTIKVLLRESMKDILPEEVRQRNDKAEFSETIIDQLNAINLEILFENASIVNLGIVSKKEITAYIIEYKKKTLSDISHFWTLVNLEIWIQTIEKDLT